MSNQITSQVLGQLTQDQNFSDWWKIENIAIPFFNNEKLSVTFMDLVPENDPDFVKEADNALKNFLDQSILDRNSISDIVYKNCLDILQEWDNNHIQAQIDSFQTKNEIWTLVNPSEIYLSRRHRRDKDIYLAVSCGCDWEEEHGLQLVFRQGKKLTRISGHDGHLTESDAYDTPDDEDILLSSFIKYND